MDQEQLIEKQQNQEKDKQVQENKITQEVNTQINQEQSKNHEEKQSEIIEKEHLNIQSEKVQQVIDEQGYEGNRESVDFNDYDRYNEEKLESFLKKFQDNQEIQIESQKQRQDYKASGSQEQYQYVEQQNQIQNFENIENEIESYEEKSVSQNQEKANENLQQLKESSNESPQNIQSSESEKFQNYIDKSDAQENKNEQNKEETLNYHEAKEQGQQNNQEQSNKEEAQKQNIEETDKVIEQDKQEEKHIQLNNIQESKEQQKQKEQIIIEQERVKEQQNEQKPEEKVIQETKPEEKQVQQIIVKQKSAEKQKQIVIEKKIQSKDEEIKENTLQKQQIQKEQIIYEKKEQKSIEKPKEKKKKKAKTTEKENEKEEINQKVGKVEEKQAKVQEPQRVKKQEQLKQVTAVISEEKQKKQKKVKKSKKVKDNKQKIVENQEIIVAQSEVKEIEQEKKPEKDNKEQKMPQNRDLPLKENAIQQKSPQVIIMQIIKSAQKERIGSTFQLFLRYMKEHDNHSENQKKVLMNIYQQIDRKKKQKYVLIFILKQYFTQYATLTKDFHEKSYKVSRSQNKQQNNKYINMGEQLKQGLEELIFLRKSTGNDFHRLHEFIISKTIKQIQIAMNGYVNQMNKAQNQSNEKKKVFLEIEQTFKKRVWKLTKIFTRGKDGKPQDQDVFIQTLKFIKDEKLFRESLVSWGKTIPEIRKHYFNADEKLVQELQVVMNNFKNQANSLYVIHKDKFSKVLASREEIKRQNSYDKLCTLVDADYVKYALEVFKKKQYTQISEKNFETFLQMSHFELLTGDPVELLRGTLSKSFQLKNKEEELINTISGNLVWYNKLKVEFKDKFVIKNLSAQIVGDGVVQFDEIIKGIFFDNNRTVRLAFKDEDRAEELICYLNEKI